MDRRDFLKYLGVAGAGAALLGINPSAAAAQIVAQSTSKNRLNILFDSWSSQVLFQRKPSNYPPGVDHPTVTKQRLNTILGAMKSYGLGTMKEWQVSFTNARVTKGKLQGVDVYVSLTREINLPGPPRHGTGFSYKDSELTALENFVTQGGGILLMTDHGHGPSAKTPDYTANDAALASLFGVTLQNLFVTKEELNLPGYMVMEMNTNLPGDLSYLVNQVAAISSHDSCIMLPPADFTPLAMFPQGATAYDVTKGSTVPLPNDYFSILVPFGAGKVIVVGNSGMVGDYGSPNPAPGIIQLENNLQFFLNCVSFLGGLTCKPDPGQGPC
jgi:hypothetical protein